MIWLSGLWVWDSVITCYYSYSGWVEVGADTVWEEMAREFQEEKATCAFLFKYKQHVPSNGNIQMEDIHYWLVQNYLLITYNLPHTTRIQIAGDTSVGKIEFSSPHRYLASSGERNIVQMWGVPDGLGAKESYRKYRSKLRLTGNPEGLMADWN